MEPDVRVPRARIWHHVQLRSARGPLLHLHGDHAGEVKLAEDLLTTIGALFGGMRGGLALAVVFVGALLAAATGVVGAA